ASIFKDHITQSFLLSYAALIWAGRARLAQGKWRLLWIMMVLLSAYCIVFLLQGRTGYMTLALLVLYAGFHFSRARMKGVAAGVALLILASFAAFHYSRPFEQRIQIAETQALNWQNNRPVGESDSIGLRLEFYTNSFRVWLKHPVWGVGTGGFARAYRHQVKGTGEIATDNPHNDMLLIVVQIGLIGALALFYLYFCAWQAAAALPPLYQYLARGLVILYVSGGLVDAVLFSHTESMAFAWLVALVYAGLPALQDKTCV
ncbi:MAG: O-antigen ligase family protein, partial [Pseudomonadota bacterium]|nr:O-antigen ligase family protein [Pseudomonadota bacterium]